MNLSETFGGRRAVSVTSATSNQGWVASFQYLPIFRMSGGSDD